MPFTAIQESKLPMANLKDFKRRLPTLSGGGVTLHKTHVEVDGKKSDGVLCDWNGATVKAHCLTDAEYVIVEVVDAPEWHKPARQYVARGERRQVLPTELEILSSAGSVKPSVKATPFTREELAKLSKDDLLDLLGSESGIPS